MNSLTRTPGIQSVPGYDALVHAAASLCDIAHLASVRGQMSRERALWLHWLAQRGPAHTAARASFVFFDAGRPQAEVAEALRAQGIEIGRGFAPFAHGVRITIGRREETQRVREALEALVVMP